MAARQFIWMNGWEKHQTFQRKRGKLWTPPWIKVYTGLLDDPDYLGLSPRRRGLLHDLWLMFGRCPAGGRLMLGRSPALIGRMIGEETVRGRDLDALNQAGWVDFCSRTVLEQRWNMFWNRSGLEVEVDREKELRASRAVTPTRNAARATLNGNSPNSPEPTFEPPTPKPEAR